MSLFKSSPPPPPEPAPAAAPSPASSRFFHRRAPSDSVPNMPSEDNHSVRSGLTNSLRSSAPSFFSTAPSLPTPPTSPEPRSLSSRFSLKNLTGPSLQRDPAVLLARQKVLAAREAEAEADRAILHARTRVRDALSSVKELEEDAKEGALRAKAKQAETKLLSKTAAFLGRHGQ